MGLDVRVYEGPLAKVEPTVRSEDDGAWDRAYEEGWLFPTDHNGFGRGGDLEMDVAYAATASRGFRAGSYGGYGEYRAALCRAVIGVEPEAVWKDPERYAREPFFEQIHFGDNQDTLGPEVCAKLAEDYATHADAVKAAMGDDDWAVSKYDEWARAFAEAGATGGAVDYR